MGKTIKEIIMCTYIKSSKVLKLVTKSKVGWKFYKKVGNKKTMDVYEVKNSRTTPIYKNRISRYKNNTLIEVRYFLRGWTTPIKIINSGW